VAVDEIMILNVDFDVYNSNANLSATDFQAELMPARSIYQGQTMIASVVATLAEVGDAFQEIVDEFAEVPGVEIGDVGNDTHRVPMTIDSPAPNALEEVTRRLQECRGVAFVDVVFVHFENESESEPAANSGEMDNS